MLIKQSKLFMKHLTIILLFLIWHSSLAQIGFELDESIPFSVNGEELERATEGGLSSAQFQSIDLNRDGVQDLIIYHRISRSLSTYLYLNGEWIHSPEYSNLLPSDISNWVVIKDFDCDGRKDLFTSTSLGVKVYRNVSEDELSWQVASNFLTFDEGSNIQVAATDIPGIADINGDGAIDLITYRFGSSGSVVYYENTGDCGDLSFTRVTRSWGNFYDCGCNDFSFGQPCATGGEMANTIPSGTEAIQHIGGKTLLPFDADGDGDMDIVTSDELCSNLIYLENVGNATAANMTAFSTFPTNNPVDFDFFPAAFLEDIDQDGLQDLIVSTNLDNNPGNLANLSNHIQVFQNQGSNTQPAFSQAEPFLQTQMIDLGEHAFPTFWDHDEDGDLDLLISNQGRIGQYSSVFLFENIGNRFEPSFELTETDFANLSRFEYTGLKPQWADLDGDGIIDLTYQAKPANSTTRLFFSKGNADGSYQEPIDLEFDVSVGSNPFVIDLNSDGLNDLLIGEQFGSLTYYQNEGGLNFIRQSDFGGLENDFNRQNLSVSIARFGNRFDQLLTIDGQGRLRLYNNIADENWTRTELTEDLIVLNEQRTGFNFGRASYLAAADLNDDGKASLVIGTSRGGIYLLNNITERNGDSENELRVAVSPNPTSSNLKILINSAAIGRLIDLQGKVIIENIPFQASVVEDLSLNLPPGLYLLQLITADGRSTTKKIIIEP